MAIEVTSKVMHALAQAARNAHPKEACGILTGGGKRITHFIQTRNVHSVPETHFEVDPQALIDAHRAAREGGPRVLGYFHSHPNGFPQPSATDLASAAGDGMIWAIAGSGDIRFFRSGKAGFEPLGSTIIDS